MDNNSFYRKFLTHFGMQTPDGRAKSMAWESHLSQITRFEIAAKEMDRGTLLDVGAGVGDFARFLKAANPVIEYHGIDIYPVFVSIAREEGIEVKQMNLFDVNERYDFIYAGGTFAIEGDIRKGIRHLLPLARKKLIVNALHSKHKESDNLQTADPSELVNEFGGRIIKDERLPIDFFLVIEK